MFHKAALNCKNSEFEPGKIEQSKSENIFVDLLLGLPVLVVAEKVNEKICTKAEPVSPGGGKY